MNLSTAHRFSENGAEVTYGVGVAMGDQRTLLALWSGNCRKIYRDLQHKYEFGLPAAATANDEIASKNHPTQIKEKYR